MGVWVITDYIKNHSINLIWYRTDVNYDVPHQIKILHNNYLIFYFMDGVLIIIMVFPVMFVLALLYLGRQNGGPDAERCLVVKTPFHLIFTLILGKLPGMVIPSGY